MPSSFSKIALGSWSRLSSFMGEFPKLDPQLLFKAMGGLFMGLVLMGDHKKPVSETDVEELLNQLITDPTKK